MGIGAAFGAQVAAFPEATTIVMTASSLYTLGHIFGKGGLADVWSVSSKQERGAIVEQIIENSAFQLAGFDIGYTFAKTPVLPESTQIWGTKSKSQNQPTDFFAEDKAFSMNEQVAYQQEIDVFKSLAKNRQDFDIQKISWVKTTGQVPTPKSFKMEFYNPETFTKVEVSGYVSGFPGIETTKILTVKATQFTQPTYSSLPVAPSSSFIPKTSPLPSPSVGPSSPFPTGGVRTAGGGQTLLLDTPIVATAQTVKTIQLPISAFAGKTVQVTAMSTAFAPKMFVPLTAFKSEQKFMPALAFDKVVTQEKALSRTFDFKFATMQKLDFKIDSGVSQKKKFSPALGFDFKPDVIQAQEATLSPFSEISVKQKFRLSTGGFDFFKGSSPKSMFMGPASARYTPSLGGIFFGKKGQTPNLKGIEIRGVPRGWKL
jgi:hypothetical protein